MPGSWTGRSHKEGRDADPSAHPFSNLVRRYRRATGLTQAELAERARLSVLGLNDLERGAHHHHHQEEHDRAREHASHAGRSSMRLAAGAVTPLEAGAMASQRTLVLSWEQWRELETHRGHDLRVMV
jgi:Helix-turn-helix domain